MDSTEQESSLASPVLDLFGRFRCRISKVASLLKIHDSLARQYPKVAKSRLSHARFRRVTEKMN